MHGFSPDEIAGDKQQGENHSRYSVIDELLASYAVDDDKCKDGGEHVYESYENLVFKQSLMSEASFYEKIVLTDLEAKDLPK